MGDTFNSAKRKSIANDYQMIATDKFAIDSKMSKKNKENSESRPTISAKSS